MNFTQNLLYLILSLATSGFVTYGISRWRKARGHISIFSQEDGLEGAGLKALSSLFSTKPADLGHGRTELRLTWGIRLVAPLAAILFLGIIDLAPLWDAFGVGPGWIRQAALVGTAIGLGYVWVMTLFVQRIVYDAHHVVSYGIDMRIRTRALRDLIDIRVHEQRPVLVLTFSDQKQLYVPKFLSHRDVFVAAMQEITNHNGNNGMIAPMPMWQARLGV